MKKGKFLLLVFGLFIIGSISFISAGIYNMYDRYYSTNAHSKTIDYSYSVYSSKGYYDSKNFSNPYNEKNETLGYVNCYSRVCYYKGNYITYNQISNLISKKFSSRYEQPPIIYIK